MGVALVFGARGFMGRHVVRGLAALPGWRMVESDLPGAADASSGIELGLDLAEASVEQIAAALGEVGPDVIVNCAGRTSGPAHELAKANVETAARLLTALASMPKRPRLIHIGSASEYGPAPTGIAVREDAATAPVGPYGASKLAATRLVCEAASRGAIEGLVLRVFNAAGPGMPEGTLAGSAVSRLKLALESGAPEIEMGPLQAVRDFVDVRDVAAAVAAASLAPLVEASIVNVGTGQAHTARELVEALARAMGYRGLIAERAAGSARSGDVPWMVADVSLAERSLGWRAVHDLDSVAANIVGASTPGA